MSGRLIGALGFLRREIRAGPGSRLAKSLPERFGSNYYVLKGKFWRETN